MPSSTFYCPKCREPFTYCDLGDPVPGADALGPERELAANGVEVDCPYCKTPATYLRHQLVYRV